MKTIYLGRWLFLKDSRRNQKQYDITKIYSAVDIGRDMCPDRMKI